MLATIPAPVPASAVAACVIPSGVRLTVAAQECSTCSIPGRDREAPGPLDLRRHPALLGRRADAGDPADADLLAHHLVPPRVPDHQHGAARLRRGGLAAGALPAVARARSGPAGSMERGRCRRRPARRDLAARAAAHRSLAARRGPVAAVRWVCSATTSWSRCRSCSAGLAVAAPLSALPERADRLYAADLLGAGLGCLAAVAALTFVDGASAVVLCAATFAAAAFCYAPSGRQRLGFARSGRSTAARGTLGGSRLHVPAGRDQGARPRPARPEDGEPVHALEPREPRRRASAWGIARWLVGRQRPLAPLHGEEATHHRDPVRRPQRQRRARHARAGRAGDAGPAPAAHARMRCASRSACW